MEKIGIIGLGNMGMGIAKNVIKGAIQLWDTTSVKSA
jgi:3-hydroxyisobutyrate dehydrogenase-like beta-hydroxyacid dehydrogenase